jgi:poly-gamma-glutamate synthesis protein (capsule biosynthesis protein)
VIEIYKGRPIFYSLSSLTYSLGLHFRGVDLPIEWDDSIVAITKFDKGKLHEIALYPIVHSQLTNDTSVPVAKPTVGQRKLVQNREN